MDLRNYLDNQPIRNKLFVSYFSGFIIALLLGSFVVYYFVRNNIEKNIESELQNSTTTILNMVRTSASVSLKNYLRAVVEKNLDIVEYYYNQYQSDLISEDEAKKRATEIMLTQKIGKSGYIYCIDSKGVLRVHPQKALRGVNISQYAFAQEQKRRKEGYLEYDWRNPGEQAERPKMLQMKYFEPWDWIVSASSYREESSDLVNVDDFRDSIMSLQFGKTGYSYIINSYGKLVIHPKLEGTNIISETDANGREFIKEICKKRSGKIIYPWRNPDESSSREKLVIFNYIPELDWIVTSSSYFEEFYSPLKTIRNMMLSGFFFSLILFFAITSRISSSITNPLEVLKDKFDNGATGDFSVRMNRQANDEIGQLAAYFNSFMAKLETYSTDLKKEIQERKQAEDALRSSEEMFSKAFRSSPSGISITSMADMRFINVNNSLLQITGYQRDELIDQTLASVKFFSHKEEALVLLQSLEKERRLRSIPIEFMTRCNELRMGILSAEIIELWGEQCMLATIEDVTEANRLEKEIMDISEKERLSIGQDLHDDLCPHLIGIEVLGKVLKRKLEAREISEAALAGKIRSLIKEAINKTRSLARGLCPVNLATHGLKSSIEDLALNVSDIFGITCLFQCTCPVVFHDNSIATHIYYIIHEAVHNAVKHGQADNIIIEFAQQNGKYCLSVTDDGMGFKDVQHSRGMGLRIMELRAKKIGAEFEIEEPRVSGTCIRVKLLKRQALREMQYESE